MQAHTHTCTQSCTHVHI